MSVFIIHAMFWFPVWLQVKFEDEKSEMMDVYLYQTEAEFRKLLQCFTGLPSGATSVFYIEMLDGQQIGIEEMRMPHKTLVTYNFNKGDEIHIYRKQRWNNTLHSTSDWNNTVWSCEHVDVSDKIIVI